MTISYGFIDPSEIRRLSTRQQLVPRDANVFNFTGNNLVVAVDSKTGRMVGLHSYGLFRHRYKKYYAEGTWVHRKYRKLGVAKNLWRIGLETEDPVQVSVFCVSEKGFTLVKSLEEYYGPKIKWKISTDVDMADLRKGSSKLNKLRATKVR